MNIEKLIESLLGQSDVDENGILVENPREEIKSKFYNEEEAFDKHMRPHLEALVSASQEYGIPILFYAPFLNEKRKRGVALCMSGYSHRISPEMRFAKGLLEPSSDAEGTVEKSSMALKSNLGAGEKKH